MENGAYRDWRFDNVFEGKPVNRFYACYCRCNIYVS